MIADQRAVVSDDGGSSLAAAGSEAAELSPLMLGMEMQQKLDAPEWSTGAEGSHSSSNDVVPEVSATPDMAAAMTLKHSLISLSTDLIRGQEVILHDTTVKNENLPSNKVSLEHIKKACEFDAKHQLKLMPHLKLRDLDPTHFEKMNVATAHALFHHATAAGLRYLVLKNHLPKEALTTAFFLEQVFRWFTIMTSRTMKTALSELCPQKGDEAKCFLANFIAMVMDMVIVDKTGKSSWKPFQTASSFDAQQVKDCLFEVIQCAESAGVTVSAVVTDMGPGNMAIWRLCNIQATKYGKPKVSLEHVWKACETDAGHKLKLLPHLRLRDLDPNHFEKMNVASAYALLHHASVTPSRNDSYAIDDSHDLLSFLIQKKELVKESTVHDVIETSFESVYELCQEEEDSLEYFVGVPTADKQATNTESSTDVAETAQVEDFNYDAFSTDEHAEEPFASPPGAAPANIKLDS
ncbi:hypothetical protein HPB50_028515 [Hyalomma asiaticum]|nr:hypothetical protein HPB50_028515 [Hyalomma asiaticum]